MLHNQADGFDAPDYLARRETVRITTFISEVFDWARKGRVLSYQSQSELRRNSISCISRNWNVGETIRNRSHLKREETSVNFEKNIEFYWP